MNKIITKVKNMLKLIKRFFEGDKDIRISIILDKNNPQNLEKAYLLVLIKEKYIENSKWKFAFRSKKGSIKLLPNGDSTYSLRLMYGDEYDRLITFTRNKKIPYAKTIKRLKSASRVSTIKYFKHINNKETIQCI